MKNILLTALLFLGCVFTVKAQCKTVASITENFDTWKEIGKCWSAHGGKAMVYSKDKKVVFYSMTNPRENMVLFTPKIKAGKYVLTVDISDNGGETSLQLVAGKTNSANSVAFLSQEIKISGDKKVISFRVQEDSYLGLKVMLNGIHQAVYVDNLSLKSTK